MMHIPAVMAASQLFLTSVVGQIHSAESYYQIPYGLLEAVCFTESGNNPKSHSRHDGGNRDSIGLCQIQVRTAKEVGFKVNETDLKDPGINIRIAGKYLKRQYKRYHNWVDAVAAYNRGSLKMVEGKYSNQLYVDKVFRRYNDER